MFDLKEKLVLVLGLDFRGQAAVQLLLRQGARVTVLEPGSDREVQMRAKDLRAQGAEVTLAASSLPAGDFHLAVLAPAVPMSHSLVQQARGRGLHVLGELEFGFQQSKCLALAIAGTNGKATTASLIERM